VGFKRGLAWVWHRLPGGGLDLITGGAFCDDLRLGLWGEDIVIEYLKELGYLVLQTSEIYSVKTNTAARMSGIDCNIIVPDILACRNGKTSWVEVKVKESPVLYRKEGQYTHGIDTYKFHDYLKVQKNTGIGVDVYIVEVVTQKLLCAPLSLLAENVHSSKNGVTFFLRSNFTEIANLEGRINLEEFANQSGQHGTGYGGTRQQVSQP